MAITMQQRSGLDRRLAESMWTREQAIEWAEGRFDRSRTWTSRRFRVEESPAGKSSLLSRYGAEKAKVSYGGRIVEVIPDRLAYLEEFQGIRFDRAPKRTVARGLPACQVSSCLAKEGEPCVRDGQTRWPHKKRAPLPAALHEQAKVYDACHVCAADAGVACTSKLHASYGEFCWPHKNRRFLAAATEKAA